MTTVTRTLSNTFTGQTVNPLPLAIPSAGVLGVTHRWRAADIAGTDGTAIASWTAALGGIALTQGTGSAQPLLKIESGVRMLRFDGTNDVMAPATAPTASNVRTLTIVARVRAALGSSQGILNTSTGAIQRGSTGNTLAYGGGTGASNTTVVVDPTSTTTFHTITLALGLDQAGNAVRSVNVDGTTATVNGDSQATTVRPGEGFSATYGNIDVLEIIGWPFALDATQRLAVRTQMQALYPSIVA